MVKKHLREIYPEIPVVGQFEVEVKGSAEILIAHGPSSY